VAAGKNELSCQMALYPLGQKKYGQIIGEIIGELEGEEGVHMEVGPLGTLLQGPSPAIWKIIREISEKADQKGDYVLQLTLSNVCGLGNRQE